MSAELIIIIVGGVFMLLALLDSITSTSMISTSLRIPMGIMGIFLIMYGGYTYGAINQHGQIEQPDLGNVIEVTYPIEKIQVLSPVSGDAVKCRILTTGVYPDAHDKDIWVLLKPTDKKYYPQSDHTNTSFKRNGEWQVITRFGGDQSEPFEIIIYETDEQASRFFSSTIRNWKDMKSYPGLADEELPAGATEVDRIQVTLADNCRGVF